MARIPPKISELMTVFIDESSQTAHRYLALGALAMRNSDVAALETRIAAARLPELPKGEMSWTKVSNAKLDAYKRVVDVFFTSGSDSHPLQFHVLVEDTRQLRDKVFNKGSRDIGFNKEIYQLCMKVAKRLYKTKLFHVYPDQRSTKSRPEELRDILNHGLRKAGDPRDWPFRRLHFRNSADTLPLQLADILLGSITFKINGHYAAAGASAAKRELADYIHSKAGISRVDCDTALAGKFTIWIRKLR
jgi:hypothetical protein